MNFMNLVEVPRMFHALAGDVKSGCESHAVLEGNSLVPLLE